MNEYITPGDAKPKGVTKWPRIWLRRTRGLREPSEPPERANISQVYRQTHGRALGALHGQLK